MPRSHDKVKKLRRSRAEFRANADRRKVYARHLFSTLCLLVFLNYYYTIEYIFFNPRLLGLLLNLQTRSKNRTKQYVRPFPARKFLANTSKWHQKNPTSTVSLPALLATPPTNTTRGPRYIQQREQSRNQESIPQSQSSSLPQLFKPITKNPVLTMSTVGRTLFPPRQST